MMPSRTVGLGSPHLPCASGLRSQLSLLQLSWVTSCFQQVSGARSVKLRDTENYVRKVMRGTGHSGLCLTEDNSCTVRLWGPCPLA